MKADRVVAWLSLGAPLLIVLAVVAVQQRDGNDRVQALPAVAVGSGLILSVPSVAAAAAPGCSQI